MDAKSYRSKDPQKVLAQHKCKKKQKHLDACLTQHQHVTPFVMSTYRMVGCEAKEPLKRLSLRLSDKWQQPYSAVQGFINARISIVIVRAAHLCLRGSHVPISKISGRFQWEDSAGLGLFQTDY
jgi:hypothetical protein